MINIYDEFSQYLVKSAGLMDLRIINIKIVSEEKILYELPCPYSDMETRLLNIKVQEQNHKVIDLNIVYSGIVSEHILQTWIDFIKMQWQTASRTLQFNYQLKARDLLLYTSKTLASSLRLEDVLRQILNNTLEVIEAADAGSLYLYDERSELLVPMVTGGFDWNYIRKMAIKSGESLTGLTFSRREPMIFHRTDDVYDGMLSMSEQNRHFFDLAVPRVNGVPAKSRGAMCCPFIIKDKCYGVVSINNFLTDAVFRDEDLELLEAICNQSVLAIERARLFQEIENRADELKRLNTTINRKNELLEYASQTHKQLTEIVLQKKGIDEIGRTISRIIHKPIVVFDEYIHVLTATASSEELGFEIEMPSFLDKLKQIQHHQQPVHINPGNYYPVKHSLYVSPIITSYQVKGYMVIVECNGPLKELEKTTVEQACTVLALEMLKEEAIYETKQRLKGEFLDDIHSNVNIDLIQKQARYLGISEQFHYSFITVEIDQYENHEFADMQDIKHLQHTLERAILQRNPSSLVFNRLNGVKAMIAWHKQSDEDTVIKKSRKLVQELQKEISLIYPDMTCSFGIGRLVRRLADLSQSYSDIRQCSEIIRKQKKSSQVMTYREIGLARILMNSTQQELQQFVQELLRPLIEYDHKNRNELIITLETYLKNNQSVTDAAQELHIHLNTLHYRINRIEEILGLSLKDASSYFHLQMAWNIMDTLGTRGEWLKQHN